MNTPLIVIMGPTASGKTQFALDVACKIGGEIVNADSIQVYKEIPILSSSPTSEEKSTINHHLYNYVPITEDYSVGRYIEDAIKIIHNISARNIIPILVGGTGMYIKSLCYGMHNLPQITPDIRESARNKFKELGNEKFYQELEKLDPLGASKLHPSNSQRLIRYYEIFIQTGCSITEFYKNTPSKFLENYDVKINILEPDRKTLYERCNARFLKMIEDGALNEVTKLKASYQNPIGARKAIGFNEISSYLDSEITFEEAIILSQARTRQYAKRQITWCKNQMHDAKHICFEKALPEIHDIL